MNWKTGAAKADMTPKTMGISMLGYGNPNNVVKGIHTPLTARAFYLQSGDSKLLMINLELCFITDILRKTIIEKLNQYESFTEAQVHLSAQHTHSAHSGFTHYALYNMPTPGFVPEVLESYAQGCVNAYLAAKNTLSDSSIEFKQSSFASDVPVSFNRSLEAYLKNPEVKKERLPTEKSAAVDKNMRALVFKSNGNIKAAFNWFAVHTTSIRNTNNYVSPDNKGYASLDIETQRDESFVAAFAQGNAGDVSPNWVWDKKLKVMRGPHEDEFENAKFNGKLQANKLEEIFKQEEAIDLSSKLDSVICYQDFSNIKPDKEFMPDWAAENAHTTSPCHGVAFAMGAKEGPGVPAALAYVMKLFAAVVKLIDLIKSFFMSEEDKNNLWEYYNNQAPKDIFLEAGKKKVFGISNIGFLSPLAAVDPMVGTMGKFYNNGSMREHTWTQAILPVQLMRIGEVLIVATPAEATTMAGERIKRQLTKMFKDHGIKEVISAPYSNAFCGYIVTPEEYEEQLYEGGHCVFGKWTLPAFQTVIKKLAVEMLKDKNNRDLSWSIDTPQFSEFEISNRSYSTQ